MTYEVSQLPPTLGIKDPEVKSFLDALSNAWDQRSGNIDYEDKNRFITKGEFQDMATSAVANMFSGGSGADGIGGGSGTGGSGKGTVGEVISLISDHIKKTYLYQLLGSEFDTVDIRAMNSRVDDVIDGARTLFMQERTQRESDIEAVTSQVTLQASRIDGNTGAISEELNTRSTKDQALAQAINTIWANVGGNAALIQDNELAAVTPSAVSASKWSQVQAEVIDQSTGSGRVTAVREDMTSYISKTDGTLRSTWSVRVKSGSGGRAIVGGVGLALTESGSEGPTIDFGVRADKFWVGNTSGQGDLPFVILTEPVTIGGTYVPAGTYIKDAFIKNASVDTLKVAGEAVSKVRHVNHFWSTTVPTTGSVEIFSTSYTVPAGTGLARLVAQVSTPLYAVAGNSVAVGLRLFIDGSQISDIGVTSDGNAHMIGTAGAGVVWEGDHTVSVQLYLIPPWNGSAKQLSGVLSVVMHGALR